ncbi:MAG: hypothetical protein ACREQ4_14095 [Candidatus Binataceae bacterium]
MGPRILGENPDATERIINLAREFRELRSGEDVDEALDRAATANVGIAVGSEMTCLMNPTARWITNRRTVWVYYLLRNDGNYRSANEATKISAEQGWSGFHLEVRQTLLNLAAAGDIVARGYGVTPGELTYLWADAIANEMYERYYN